MSDIKLIQKPTDPMCLRVSVGGTKDGEDGKHR